MSESLTEKAKNLMKGKKNQMKQESQSKTSENSENDTCSSFYLFIWNRLSKLVMHHLKTLKIS